MGDSDIFQPQIRSDNTFQFTDNLVWVKGRHTWKFGADVRRYRLFYLVEDFGQGIFSFSDGFGSVSATSISDFFSAGRFCRSRRPEIPAATIAPIISARTSPMNTMPHSD